MIFLIGAAFLLISLILFKTISSGVKKRKRIEAEEKLRIEMQSHCKTWYIKDTVKEQRPSPLKESVTQMHPEYMASLLRNWILDDSSTEPGMKKVPREFTNRQKLAVLLIAMRSKTSTELFKYLRTYELEILAAEIKKLERPDLGEEIAILQEFQSRMEKTLGGNKQ